MCCWSALQRMHDATQMLWDLGISPNSSTVEVMQVDDQRTLARVVYDMTRSRVAVVMSWYTPSCLFYGHFSTAVD